jgi:hypothetical protein
MLLRPSISIASLVVLAGAVPSATAQCPVAAPTGLHASQGSYCGSVFLDWNDVSGPILGYDIFRNTTNNPNTASLAGLSLTSQFTDLTASVGVQYYYWVYVERLLCTSPFSSSAMGYRAQEAPAPTNVSASDGTICGAVRVSWNQTVPLGGAPDGYTIYRNTINLYATSSAVGNAGGSARDFFDYSAAPATTYYYWVRAENDCGTAASNSDSGYISNLAGPANDDCVNAAPVTAGGTYVGSTLCATRDGFSSCGLSGNQGRDVWYRFTAPSSGVLHLDTCGVAGSFRTLLSVHIGDICPANTSTQYACNIDGCGSQSTLDVPVNAGASYLIRVAGYSANDMGIYELHVGFTGACYANCDASTIPPVLNVNDFVCFQSRFAAANASADCDHNSTLNVNDFICFQSAFAAGCP